MANFGIGIGLQGVPETYGAIAAQRQRFAEAQKAAQQKADDDQWQKYLDDVKVTGVHRLDQDEANQKVAQTLSQLQKLKDENPKTWKNKAGVPISQLQMYQQEALKRNERLNKITDEYDQIKKSGGYTTSAQDKLAEAIKSGDWNQVSLVNDELGSVGFDPKSKGVTSNWIPQVNTNEIDKSFLNNDDYKTRLTYSKGKIALPDGKQILATSSGIPVLRSDAMQISKQLGQDVTSLEDINAKLLSDPAYMHKKVAQQYADGRITGFSKMSDQEKYAAVAKNNLDDLKKSAGVKVDTQVISPLKKSKGKEGQIGLNASLDDLSKYITESQIETMASPERVALQKNVDKLSGQIQKASKDTNFDKDKLEGMKQSLEAQQTQLSSASAPKAETKYNFPLSFKTEGASTVVNNNEDVIDLTTGQRLKGVNQFNFKPRWIKLRSINGEWKPYVYGDSMDKEGAVNAKGGVESDKSVTAELAVPLDKVEGFLNKNNNPTQWVKEAVQRASAGGGKIESPDLKVQTFKVGGKTYNIPADQVDEFKKDMGIQ